MSEKDIIDVEQPIESEVKRQEVDKTRKVLLVHRRGIDVVANENTRENPDMLEIRLLNGKGRVELKRVEYEDKSKGFRFEVFKGDGTFLKSFTVNDIAFLEGQE